ncbi:MAG: hypothetical protein N3I86_11460 [Verrucomicrobiae bacterium]|nr:hypothetical protein [Verrucomicrobiae bacterium]MDW8308337.1 hypothetical protein [Verrucomicrobiales bacterium]
MRRRAGIAVAWLAALSMLPTPVALAQTNDSARILFLHVQWREGTPVLQDWSVRPGHVKPRAAADGAALRVEVQDDAGRTLWQTVVPDPRMRRLESHDPAQRDRAAAARVIVENAEFTLRVPVLREARRVEFFAEETGAAAGSGRWRSLGQLKLPIP